MRIGWQCGRCGAVNSPDTKQCTCQPPQFHILEPVHDFECAACKAGGVCMCVRPDRGVTC